MAEVEAGERTSERKVSRKRKREIHLDTKEGTRCEERFKRQKLIFCLAEGLRCRWRADIRKANSLEQGNDKAGVNHLVYFSCANEKDLEQVQGILGLTKSLSNTTAKLAEATIRVFTEFCTPGHGAPRRPPGPLRVDEELLKHMRMINEVSVADGLRSAQNAHRELFTTGFIIPTSCSWLCHGIPNWL